MGRLAGQDGDLDQVVGQDPVSGPDPGAVEVVEAGAVPAVLPFEGADPGLATGPPLHCSAERPAVFVGLASLAGSALAGDHHGPDPELLQVVVDAGLAVAAIGGHGPRTPPSPGDDPPDRRGEVGRVGRGGPVAGV